MGTKSLTVLPGSSIPVNLSISSLQFNIPGFECSEIVEFPLSDIREKEIPVENHYTDAQTVILIDSLK